MPDRTVREELQALWRSFPRVTEYAISREMAERYELEAITILRFCTTDVEPARTYPVERLGAITAQRFPMNYRGRPLVVVEAAHA